MENSARKNSRRNTRTSAVDKAAVRSLIADLQKEDANQRRNARLALVKIGDPAIAPLTHLLRQRNDFVRWEATKTLAELKRPAAACSLVRSLEDKAFGTRWLAAEGLVCLGHPALENLLEALMRNPDRHLLHQGAHHVLRALTRKGESRELLQPVISALEDAEPSSSVPFVAKSALERLRAEEAALR